MDDLVGRTVGPYQLESIIGRGPTGYVYRGLRPGDARRVAIKTLHASIAVGADFAERFLAEMRSISSLRSRNIVTLYDFGESDGLYYIAMELMLGGSVGALLRRRPPGDPLPVPLAIDLISQAAEGLASAHERGIVHNDIQPGNLLLDEGDTPASAEAEVYTLKIADFGLAHLAASGSGMTAIGIGLGSGMLLGAPAYMSPELSRGQPLDGRSDLYSLGVVLYEMLTGMQPFPVTRPEDPARERLFAPPPLPRLLNSEIPASLEYVMVRCLAKRADDRFASALDLARAARAAATAA
ncbi:MAG TPA: serine/threonine-protein kinase [Ktedonobacterales bacterium]